MQRKDVDLLRELGENGMKIMVGTVKIPVGIGQRIF